MPILEFKASSIGFAAAVILDLQILSISRSGVIFFVGSAVFLTKNYLDSSCSCCYKLEANIGGS